MARVKRAIEMTGRTSSDTNLTVLYLNQKTVRIKNKKPMNKIHIIFRVAETDVDDKRKAKINE